MENNVTLTEEEVKNFGQPKQPEIVRYTFGLKEVSDEPNALAQYTATQHGKHYFIKVGKYYPVIGMLYSEKCEKHFLDKYPDANEPYFQFKAVDQHTFLNYLNYLHTKSQLALTQAERGFKDA